MTHAEIELFVNRFSYKPNWRIRWIPPDPLVPSGTLRVSHTEPNSDDEENLIDVSKDYCFDPAQWEDEFVHARIVEMIERMEQHEINEWLRFDGTRLTDPHASSLQTDPIPAWAPASVADRRRPPYHVHEPTGPSESEPGSPQ